MAAALTPRPTRHRVRGFPLLGPRRGSKHFYSFQSSGQRTPWESRFGNEIMFRFSSTAAAFPARIMPGKQNPWTAEGFAWIMALDSPSWTWNYPVRQTILAPIISSVWCYKTQVQRTKIWTHVFLCYEMRINGKEDGKLRYSSGWKKMLRV